MIIFLYGEDTFRSRKKLKEFKDKFIKEVDPNGSSLVFVDGETANLEKINEAVGARSLFTRKRMIIIERIFANKSEKILEKIYEYFKSKGKEKSDKDDNIIIFWDDISGAKLEKNKLFKFLGEQKITQNFKKLSNAEIICWIKNEVQARDAKIQPQAVSLLAGLFPGDLWQLNNEIDKLINHKKAQLLPESEAVISKEDIDLLCRGKIDENIFALTDAISNKNKALALSLFEKEIEAGMADAYLLTMIVRQFKILLQVKEAVENRMNPRKIASELQIHPFVVQKCLAQVNGFTLLSLKNIFSSLVEADRGIKTGQVDFKSAVSLLLAKL